MTPVRLVVSLVLAAVLVAPSALAASASGELETASATFAQGLDLVSQGVDVLSVSSQAPVLTLDAEGVTIHRIGKTTISVPAGPLGGDIKQSDIDERQSFDRATLTLTSGSGDQVFALRALGAATAELSSAEMTGVAGALLAAIDAGASCKDYVGPTKEMVYCLDVLGAYGLSGPGTVDLLGETNLILFGPTLELRADGEQFAFESGLRPGPNGVGADESWVVLRAENVRGSVEATDMTLYSAAPTITSPRAEFQNADGALRVGMREYRASSDNILAAGALVLAPGPVAAAADREYEAAGPQYAPTFTTRISGDVQSINLNSAPAFLDSPAERGILAALIGLAIAGLAYAWQHITFFAAAMYTRLNKPDILNNDVRNRIYDIIRENPGISAREAHRRSEQSWGTVVYHLRQLERHHLVVSRSLGRTRNYYENHGKYRGMEVQLACLQSDRARVLARAIATQPGITQEQLAAASGYPQPTTSYYVRKLKQAGLVEEQREGRYVKYVPHADLPRFIAMSEHAPTTGTTTPSGVQA